MTPDEKDARPDEVVVECEMDATPEKVWRALTDEALAADWLGASPAAEGAEGPNYRILEAEPFSRIRYAWHDPDCPDAPPTVTIELKRLASGCTWFRLTHGQAVASISRTQAANANGPLALAA